MFESAILLGNGESRKYLDLAELHALARISNTAIGGCNAIIDDFLPDVLAAVDPPMIAEIRQKWIANPSLAESCDFWTCMRDRPDNEWVLDPSGDKAFPYRGYNAGHMLGLILAKYYAKRIYMVGVDIYPMPGNEKRPNNVYRNRTNYSRDIDPPAPHWHEDTRTWRKIFDRHHEVLWVWQRPFPEAKIPTAWLATPNLIVEDRKYPWTYV